MKTRTRTLAETKEELDVLLHQFIGAKQDKQLEAKAQHKVNDYFRMSKARKLYTLVGNSGIEITGVRLAFDLGLIGLGRWQTAFWPTDVFAVQKLVKNCVALGYVNNCQLYIEKKDSYPILVVRERASESFMSIRTEWCPKTQGVPGANSVFFVALERARALGYLEYLNQGHENEIYLF